MQDLLDEQKRQRDAAAKRQAYQAMAMQQQLQQAAMYPAGREDPRFPPSDKYPNTMGWRAWTWDMTRNELRSPIQMTVWDGVELRCERWDESDVVRGVAGIHAHLVPDDWHKLDSGDAPNLGMAYPVTNADNTISARITVHGLAERFGKFALGREGWRTEWAVIRKLFAPTQAIGLALEKAFPEVEIIYGDR